MISNLIRQYVRDTPSEIATYTVEKQLSCNTR